MISTPAVYHLNPYLRLVKLTHLATLNHCTDLKAWLQLCPQKCAKQLIFHLDLHVNIYVLSSTPAKNAWNFSSENVLLATEASVFDVVCSC